MNKTYKDCWEYFRKNKNKESATCNICEKQLSCKGSATIGLRRHLEGVHRFKRVESMDEPSTSSSSFKSVKRFRYSDDNETINKFITRPILSEIISKLATVDRFSFNQITKSEFIRHSLSIKGFSLPRNSSDVMQLMMDYYTQKKEELIKKIKTLKLNNKKFSISIDEWTSINNKRYMDVHMYYSSKESTNLGLIPIHGSCTAEKALELLTVKLNSFCLSLQEDVLAVMSDGASVMQKFGRLSPAYQQLCYNHGIHLAVLKIFYVKKNTDDTQSGDSDENNRFLENENKDSADSDNSDSDVETIETLNVQLRPTIRETVTAIRKMVKIFKNSPVKNDILQKYIEEEQNTKLKLILDCKTRWNTMEAMIRRFLRVRNPIKRALSEINVDYMWNDEYIKFAEILLATLEPIRITIENLSREDSTLLTAEGALKFLFKTLEKLNTELGNEFLVVIKEEISKRRDKVVVSLMKYLHNPESLQKDSGDTFFYLTSKADMYKMAKQILSRLLGKYNNDNDSYENSEKLSDSQNEELSLKKQLELEIAGSLQEFSIKSLASQENKFRTITKEFQIFQSTGKRTPNLQQLLDVLHTIKPTSTQNERNFSTATDFVTKKRSRLSDSTLDALCFLRSHFKTKA